MRKLNMYLPVDISLESPGWCSSLGLLRLLCYKAVPAPCPPISSFQYLELSFFILSYKSRIWLWGILIVAVCLSSFYELLVSGNNRTVWDITPYLVQNFPRELLPSSNRTLVKRLEIRK
ncbi:hypothetical protein BJY01DRAFT_72994 [Aspergillus pseudoustus]|uniref:Uncharacterized protein n=1 Tax=Aspergillus pseudoustus TaxID=1810923 RepID=A0ABR4L0K3_9EURO